MQKTTGQTQPQLTAPDRIELEGVRLAAVSESQAIELIIDRLSHRRGGWVCSVNVDILRQCASNPDLRELVDSADLPLADGMPVLWLARLRGLTLPERVPGSSLIVTLPRALSARAGSVFLIGGNPGAADRAGAVLAASNPGLRISGTLCPRPGFEHDGRALRAISDALALTRPDVVFVGLGFPKQDRLISELRRRFPECWFVSCGISLSFVAGEIPRAPRWMQAAGLEWAHRLAREPRRLARRYLRDDLPYAARVLARSLATGARARVARPLPR